jgi:Tfp pilus assembly protein PilF
VDRILKRTPKEIAPYFALRVPSIQDVRDWVREDPKRRRKILACWAVAFVALIALAFAAPTLSRHIKAWHARRLAARADMFVQKQKWREASQNLADAFRLRSTEPEVWRVYARFLTRTGQGNFALQWWQKLSVSRELTLDDKRDFAAAALSASELAIAAEQVAHLVERPGGPIPADLVLAGQLATVRGYTSTALDFCDRVLNDARATSFDKLGANLVNVANSGPELKRYQDAVARIIEIARNENDPASAQALAVLGRQIPSSQLTGTENNSPFGFSTPVAVPRGISLSDIADRLERNAYARPLQRMLAMELRAKVSPDREDSLVHKAIDLYANEDDETLVALGAWLYTRHRFAQMLDVIPIEHAEERRDLLMERIDALAALERYAELRELLRSEHAVLEQAFQHMYLAVVQRKLKDVTATANEWARALDAANSPRALIGLADYAEKNGALDIADEAYARLIRIQPELKSGYTSRLRIFQSRGETALAHDEAIEMVRRWPEDDATRMREVYLRVLLAQSASAAKEAEMEAAPYLAKNPWDGIARSALALAQLKQGQARAALTTLTEFTSQVPASAISLPVYAAALAANGWKDKAREQAKQLATENILPEERVLIKGL